MSGQCDVRQGFLLFSIHSGVGIAINPADVNRELSTPRSCPGRKDYRFRTRATGSTGSLHRQPANAYDRDAEVRWHPEVPARRR